MRTLGALFATLTILAACGTPQEQCIQRETREIRVIERLTSEIEGNLARGYAIRKQTYELPVWRICSVERNKKGQVTRQNFCWDTETHVRNVPQAIDVKAEQRKLSDLKARRAKLVQLAAPRVAQCKTTYPQ